jgi:hypothetical protein
MKKQASRGKPRQGEVIGLARFEKISAVEGIRLSDEMKRTFAEFDRRGLTSAQRRRAILQKFKSRLIGSNVPGGQ